MSDPVATATPATAATERKVIAFPRPSRRPPSVWNARVPDGAASAPLFVQGKAAIDRFADALQAAGLQIRYDRPSGQFVITARGA